LTTRDKPDDKKQDDKNHEIDDSVMGTARIDPNEFRARSTNPDRLSSFKYSVAGMIYMFRHEQSIKALSLVTVVILLLLVVLDIDTVDAALVLLSLGMVWMGEFINSAVEAVVDLATEEIHPMAKVAKDVAASAVMLGTFIMLVVTVLVIGPPLLSRLGI
jgi:diacylglycerol kinase (ATP)